MIQQGYLKETHRCSLIVSIPADTSSFKDKDHIDAPSSMQQKVL